jgi:hypothetical protein
MKLLVLTTSLFGEPAGGGERCTARLLQGLRDAGHRLTLIGHGEAAAARRWCDEALALGPVEPPFDTQPLARRLWAVAGALASSAAITVQRQRFRRARRVVGAQWARGFDACIVDHLQAWPWLGGVPPVPTMLVNHNLESDNYARLARAANRGFQGNPRTRFVERALMRREASRLWQLEQQALDRAAVLACLSSADSDRLAALARGAGIEPQARLVVLPGHPAAVHALPARDGRCSTLRRVGLIGNWTWAPNRAGLLWLLRHVWPLLQGRCELVLAGSGLDRLALPPGVRSLGRLADVQGFYAAIDLIAVASLHGSGVQEKAIEAIGTGLPVVATAHALRGLDTGLPPQVHRADEPLAFARLCADVPLAPAPAAAAAWAEGRRLAYTSALVSALHTLEVAGAARRAPVRLALARP